ncbi:MAG: hypothetical protein JO247_02765 [Chloroflexi bacterium]|nr:hypothetical protein [Chloroflexota bacterium]
MRDRVTSPTVTRRGFLALSGVAGLGIVLAACGSSATTPPPVAPASAGSTPNPTPPSVAAKPSAPAATGSSASVRGGLQLPSYLPFQGPKPDFAPSDDGIVPPGYLTYPKNLVTTSKGPVGKGEDVTFVTYSINPPATPVDQNVAWQAINKALGINLKTPYTAIADYSTKLPTILAGGDLPDAFTIEVVGQRIDHELDFLQQACADLTPYLAGDAIKDYPNLANLPPASWKPCVFNGKIYTLPAVTLGVGYSLQVNQNMLEAAGFKYGDIKKIDDFKAFFKAITRPGQVYGVGGNAITYYLELFRAPNNWAVDKSGTFTKNYESDGYKQAVAFAREIWDAGWVHPDTPTIAGNQGAANFYALKHATFPTDFFGYVIGWERFRAVNKDVHMNVMNPFSFDGGQVYQYQTAGVTNLTALKKGTPDRIKVMLKVMDYLASPLGTTEQLLLSQGIEHTDFDFDANGNPVLTKQGQSDVQYNAWSGIMRPPPTVSNYGDPTFVKQAHPQFIDFHKYSVLDPTIGLFSATDASKRAVLTQAFNDATNAIMFGRAPLSTFDDAVKAWRSNGGDQMRKEYEDAYAAAQ